MGGEPAVKKLVVTGSEGLLGWHTASRIHARNCATRFKGMAPDFQLVGLNRTAYSDAEVLRQAVLGADAIFHFAGVNRGEDAVVERGNIDIAEQLKLACQKAGVQPHIIYANSVHARGGTAYGRAKRRSSEILSSVGGDFSDLILPHIFGECARPNYNNVTATLIDALWTGRPPTINPDGRVELLHAGAVAESALSAYFEKRTGEIALAGRPMDIGDLFNRLAGFHAEYSRDVFPDLTDAFDLALFNAYRTGGFPGYYPKSMVVREDARGELFESSKARAGCQTFLSTTRPGFTRGDHFHTSLVERFMVVSGRATIRLRKVLTSEIVEFPVNGADPVAIDMPPLHTHHIENTSASDVVTFFWSHRLFDPTNPDTYADPVLDSKGSPA